MYATAFLAFRFRSPVLRSSTPGTAGGFKSHKETLEAQEIMRKYKILNVIEEGDTSHVNQPFDDECAIEVKGQHRNALGAVRESKVFGPILNQSHLILVVFWVANQLTAKAWKNSFLKCNLNGRHRLSFEEWIKKIAPFLEAGGSFQPEVPIDRKQLLPIWWKEKSEANQNEILDVMSNLTSGGVDWGLSSESISTLIGAAEG